MKKIKEKLHVRISKATHIVWEGDAEAVSSKNSKGPFDILVMHSNFITLIKNNPITILSTDGTKKEFKFKQSVIYVTKNNVKIFASIA